MSLFAQCLMVLYLATLEKTAGTVKMSGFSESNNRISALDEKPGHLLQIPRVKPHQGSARYNSWGSGQRI